MRDSHPEIAWKRVAPSGHLSEVQNSLLWLTNMEVWLAGLLPQRAPVALFVAPHTQHTDTLAVRLALSTARPGGQVAVLSAAEYWQHNFLRSQFLLLLRTFFAISFLPVLRAEFMKEELRKVKGTPQYSEVRHRLESLKKSYGAGLEAFLGSNTATALVYPQGGRRQPLAQEQPDIEKVLVALPNGNLPEQVVSVPAVVVADPEYMAQKQIGERRLAQGVLSGGLLRPQETIRVGLLVGQPFAESPSAAVLAQRYWEMKSQAQYSFPFSSR